MKWALVIAGLNDLQRPVESLSGTQQIALFATGVIWTRWCLIIKPKNYLLASVNFFLGGVAGMQLTRLYSYQKSMGFTTGTALQNIVTGKKMEPKEAVKEAVATAWLAHSDQYIRHARIISLYPIMLYGVGGFFNIEI